MKRSAKKHHRGRRTGTKRFEGQKEIVAQRQIRQERLRKEQTLTEFKDKLSVDEIVSEQGAQEDFCTLDSEDAYEEKPEQAEQELDYFGARKELFSIARMHDADLRCRKFNREFLIEHDYVHLIEEIELSNSLEQIIFTLYLPTIDKKGQAIPHYDTSRDSRQDRENFLLVHGINSGYGKITEDVFENYKSISAATLERRLDLIRTTGLNIASNPKLLTETPYRIRVYAEGAKRSNKSSPYELDTIEERTGLLRARGIEAGVGKISGKDFETYTRINVRTLRDRLRLIEELGLDLGKVPYLLTISRSHIIQRAGEIGRASGSSPYQRLGINQDSSQTDVLKQLFKIFSEVSKKYHTQKEIVDYGYAFIEHGKAYEFLIPTATQLRAEDRAHIILYLWRNYNGLPGFRKFVSQHYVEGHSPVLVRTIRAENVDELIKSEKITMAPTLAIRRKKKETLLAENGIIQDTLSDRLWGSIIRYSVNTLVQKIDLIRNFGYNPGEKPWLLDESVEEINTILGRIRRLDFYKDMLRTVYGHEDKSHVLNPRTEQILRANREFEQERIDERCLQSAYRERINDENFRYVLLAAKRGDDRAKDALIYNYRSRMKRLAKEHYRDFQYQDKMSFAVEGLLGAIYRFVAPDLKLDDFDSYCQKAMQYEVFNGCRKLKNQSRIKTVSIQTPIKELRHGGGVMSVITIEDNLPADDNIEYDLIEKEERLEISEMMDIIKRKMPEKDYEFLSDYYGIEKQESLNNRQILVKYGLKKESELESRLEQVLAVARTLI